MAGCSMPKNRSMKRKPLFWAMLAVIVLLSWIDYQYFNEALAETYTPLQRQLGHITILIAIVPVGYVAWRMQAATWLRKIWLIAYAAAIGLIGIIGLIQWQ